MKYLKIENPGTCSVETFFILGASLSKKENNKALIGHFGSGTKMAVNVLLRAGLSPLIVTGDTSVEFFVKKEVLVGPGGCEQTFNRIWALINGSIEKETGFMLGYGEEDWTDIGMGIREFISNAIDASVLTGNSIGSIKFGVVPEREVMIGDKTTVFIPFSEEVEAYFDTIPQRFLHFTEMECLEKVILSKNDRNLSGTGAMVYKQGVFVREMDKKSIFDYNFNEELTLDECRNVEEYAVCRAIEIEIIKKSDKTVLKRLFKALVEGENCLELGLNDMQYNLGQDREEVIKEAWVETVGENTVLCGNYQHVVDFVRQKGLIPVQVHNYNWEFLLRTCGVRADNNILSEKDLFGVTIVQRLDSDRYKLVKSWNILSDLLELGDKKRPDIVRYTSERIDFLAYHNEETIFIKHDAPEEKIWGLIVTELLAYLTGMAQNQDVLLEIVVKMISKEQKNVV